jgi:hypothetical protein
VDWIREGEVSLPRTPGEPDSLRAWRPWVLEEADGILRMWYTASAGTTSRILTAVRPPGGGWGRPAMAIDAGFAATATPTGPNRPAWSGPPVALMVYGGFDGEVGRLHMATSDDSHRWDSQGTIMQRGPEDAGGANHPCLLMTGERWWLFYTGYPGSRGGQRSVLVAAVSQTGASWDRVGTVLEPEQGENRGVAPLCARGLEDDLHVLRQRRWTSDPHRDGDLIRWPLVGPPGARSWSPKAKGSTV